MPRLFVLVLLTLFTVAAQAAEYAEGQVWKYQTRPGEEQSRIHILRIDVDPTLGPIYHLHVEGLKIERPMAPGGMQSLLPHIPVDEDTLHSSVTELLQTQSEIPDSPEGYWLWREEFEKGSAGVFNIPVSQIVQFVEDIINDRSKAK